MGVFPKLAARPKSTCCPTISALANVAIATAVRRTLLGRQGSVRPPFENALESPRMKQKIRHLRVLTCKIARNIDPPGAPDNRRRPILEFARLSAGEESHERTRL